MAEINWLSFRDIAKEFGLETFVNDPNALTTELRRLRAESHPDRSGGEFLSNDEREKYHRLDEALKFMEAQELDSNAVIPISQLPNLFEKLAKSDVSPEIDDSLRLE
ncbi:hypothetical protein [Candidatus Nitrospira salsa]